MFKHFKYFNNSFVISSLTKDQDRRQFVFDTQIKILELPPVIRYTGPMISNNFKFLHEDKFKASVYSDQASTWSNRILGASVTEAHLQILQYAKDSKFDHVTIFENDILFHKDFVDIFMKIESKLENLEWDIFYFGAFYNYHNSQWLDSDCDLFYVNKASLCAHGYIINKNAIQKINDDYQKVLDSGSYYIIDQFLGYATEFLGYKTIGVIPKLMEQGYCGSGSLTLGLDTGKEDFDFSQVVVREPNFEANKVSSVTTTEDYEILFRNNYLNYLKG